MRICIGADHRGFELKNYLVENLNNYQWRDVGSHSQDRSDYPIYTKKVCDDVLSGSSQAGIMICGSGAGPSIVANRFRGIYAVLAWNNKLAIDAKEKINANVLIIPADYVDYELACKMIVSWLNAKFLEGRYKDRYEMIDQQ